MTHKRRDRFSSTYCKKGFVCGERLKMHERTCEKDSERQIKLGKYSAVMQVGDKVWEIVKEQLEKEIDNYERNGSGWVVSRLVSRDVSFAEMYDPLKPDNSKDTDDGYNILSSLHNCIRNSTALVQAYYIRVHKTIGV